ncbi:MAG: RNA polymerase sigma factor [Thermomicrobiales bacterium]|nr:RNA polymerase sigma factor [Thermomicrobiales bacterium]
MTDSATLMSFDTLVDMHQREIYRYALHLTRNQADADDLYQDTFLKAYKAFDRLDASANYRAWLYRIATNTFLSAKRKANRERPLDVAADGELAAVQEDQPASLDARDLLVEVERFIQTLPEKQRVALVLRKYQEFDYRQIGEVLKCSDEAARANVYEALRKLRACFGDRV